MYNRSFFINLKSMIIHRMLKDKIKKKNIKLRFATHKVFFTVLEFIEELDINVSLGIGTCYVPCYLFSEYLQRCMKYYFSSRFPSMPNIAYIQMP